MKLPLITDAARAFNAGSSQMVCKINKNETAPKQSSAYLFSGLAENRASRNRLAKAISALLSAEKTILPIPNPKAGVIFGALNLRGVSINEIPPTSPNHINGIAICRI